MADESEAGLSPDERMRLRLHRIEERLRRLEGGVGEPAPHRSIIVAPEPRPAIVEPAPRRITVPSPADVKADEVAEKARREAVTILQREHLKRYDWYKGPASGELDAATHEALETYKKRYNQTVDTSDPVAVLKAIETTKSLQAALADAGYDVGAADGFMGPKARPALDRFVRDFNRAKPEERTIDADKATHAQLLEAVAALERHKKMTPPAREPVAAREPAAPAVRTAPSAAGPFDRSVMATLSSFRSAEGTLTDSHRGVGNAVGIKVGARHPGIAEMKKFLVEQGFMPFRHMTDRQTPPDVYDQNTALAVERYQGTAWRLPEYRASMPQTWKGNSVPGYLDRGTFDVMMREAALPADKRKVAMPTIADRPDANLADRLADMSEFGSRLRSRHTIPDAARMADDGSWRSRGPFILHGSSREGYLGTGSYRINWGGVSYDSHNNNFSGVVSDHRRWQYGQVGYQIFGSRHIASYKDVPSYLQGTLQYLTNNNGVTFNGYVRAYVGQGDNHYGAALAARLRQDGYNIDASTPLNLIDNPKLAYDLKRHQIVLETGNGPGGENRIHTALEGIDGFSGQQNADLALRIAILQSYAAKGWTQSEGYRRMLRETEDMVLTRKSRRVELDREDPHSIPDSRPERASFDATPPEVLREAQLAAELMHEVHRRYVEADKREQAPDDVTRTASLPVERRPDEPAPTRATA